METPLPRILIGEVLASPGPRKSANDNQHHTPEMAEDTGGLLMLGGETAWIWVADGASDMHAVSGFSSRILAQDLGRFFASQILQHPTTAMESSAQLAARLKQAADRVAECWTGHLQKNDEQSTAITRALHTWRQQSDAGKEAAVFFEFASTFSALCLDVRGNLAGASIGDSYLLYNPKGLLQFFALRKNAVTLRLKLEAGQPVFSLSCPEAERFENSEVELAALGTDGSRDTFQNLHKTLSPEFSMTPPRLAQFREALATVPPKTQDDKTFAWLGRVHAD